MTYIEGFSYAVSKARRDAFIAYAVKSAEVFKKHGALRVVEGWEDEVPDGKLTSFPKAVKRGEGEAVMFSWIEWPDKATRDAALPKAMEDMESANMAEMPFDGKRMIYGSFTAVVDS